MKARLSIILAVSALFLLSCRKEDGGNTVSVLFAPPTVTVPTVSSKALNQAIRGTEYPKAEDFSVFVATTSTEWAGSADAPATTAFMGKTGAEGTDNPYGVSCGYNPGIGASGAWDPESGNTSYGGGTAYYWNDIASNYLQTQAFSPSGAHLDMNSGAGLAHSWTTGFTFTNFTTPAVGSQYDLLYSDRTYNRQKADGAPIAISFRHALASIVVRAAKQTATYDHITMHVTGMTLKNVYRTGTFEQGLKSTRDEVSPYSDGYPQWTPNTGTETDMSGFFPEGDLVFTNYESSTGWLVSDKALLLMPQPMNHEATTHVVQLEVSFTIEDPDGQAVAQTYVIPLNSLDVGSWLPGKQYVYNLYFNPQFVNVAVRVLDWDTDTIEL